MVYYFTSGNIKIIRNIVNNFKTTSDMTPEEYMKSYIQKCSDSVDDAKLSWIVETFLGLQKHAEFLGDITNQVSKDLSEVDLQNINIIFYFIIFQVPFTEADRVYKSLFNLNKHLLNIFLSFLNNANILNTISAIAQPYYDTNYITDKIIDPLFKWKPYISEMVLNYAEYVKKLKVKKAKLPTVPLQLNVLNRKGKGTYLPPIMSPIPGTPPNSYCSKTKKMLTKSTIDQRLENIHNKNKQKALQLLNKVKNEESHYSRGKSDNYHTTICTAKNETKYQQGRPLKKKTKISSDILPQLEVKENAATLKRMNKRIQINEQQETQWLLDLLDNNNCRNTTKIEELEEFDRHEKERERLVDIEKKHLLGQISYEEAVIAKKKVQEINKKKYEDFIKEKQVWECEIENWKKILFERNRKAVENLSLLELNVLEAKNNVTVKKKELADNIKKESEHIMAKAMKEKQDELERRINMIKEIKILSVIAKKAKLPKIIDLTESSGLGLLCEMSMAELQERLSIMKIDLKEELERKKKSIREKNNAAKQKLDDTKLAIQNYLEERMNTRKKIGKNIIDTNTKEVTDLRKILQEKRKLRMQITS